MLRFFPHFMDYTTTKARFELVVESAVGRVYASLATIKVSSFVISSITFQSALQQSVQKLSLSVHTKTLSKMALKFEVRLEEESFKQKKLG